jgi:hypothetical protein
MRRSLSLLLLIPSFALGQNVASIVRESHSHPAGSPPSSAVEVLYVVDNSVLTTYNVDPQTFQATAVGTTTMPSANYVSIQTSPDGRFLYYLANPTYYSGHQKLYVFDTDATGVPGGTPVQATHANQLSGVAINPAATFFYSVAVGPVGPLYTTNFAIVRNVINPVNGSLSQPVTEATYTLDTNPRDPGLQSRGNDPLRWNTLQRSTWQRLRNFQPAFRRFTKRRVGSGPASLWFLLLCGQRLRRSSV